MSAMFNPRCKNSANCNIYPTMKCTACRYDKCVSVGMAPQAPKSDNRKEEEDEAVEILSDGKLESRPEARPLSKDKDRSQLGEYLKVICCGTLGY